MVPPYFYFRFSRYQSFLMIFEIFDTVWAHGKVVIRFAAMLWFEIGQTTTVWRNWFPWKNPMARRQGLEFGVFDQTPPKMGSRRWIFFPPQNYNSQSIGSALRASPFASFGAFAQKHTPNVASALRASPLERRKCTGHQFFALSMSASRSQTCCARLRPRRVFDCCLKLQSAASEMWQTIETSAHHFTASACWPENQLFHARLHVSTLCWLR